MGRKLPAATVVCGARGHLGCSELLGLATRPPPGTKNGGEGYDEEIGRKGQFA
jgi:hypothetical protein